MRWLSQPRTLLQSELVKDDRENCIEENVEEICVDENAMLFVEFCDAVLACDTTEF